MSGLLPVAVLFFGGTGLFAPLDIHITAPKAKVLAGEPVRLTATWSATHPLMVGMHHARVLIDSGAGFHEWEEYPPTSHGSDETAMPHRDGVGPGTPAVSAHVISVGRLLLEGRTDRARPRLAFPEPGLYWVKLRYSIGKNSASSNVVVIRVIAPKGDDLEVFDQHLLPNPFLASDHAGQFTSKVDRLLEACSPTSYLARSFVLVMKTKLREAIREAPDGSPVQGDVPRLLAQLAKRDLGNSPFDEDRLVLLAEMYEASGRNTEAIAALDELTRKYPDGDGAWRARQRHRR